MRKILKYNCKYAKLCSYCIFYNDKNKKCIFGDTRPMKWDFSETEIKIDFLKGENENA